MRQVHRFPLLSLVSGLFQLVIELETRQNKAVSGHLQYIRDPVILMEKGSDLTKTNGDKLYHGTRNIASREFTEVRSFGGANITTFSISRAFALMASNRQALKSSSGVSFGSMLAASTSSVSATDAEVFSWRAKG